MSTEPAIEERIDAAADAVGSVWPLHSFVTANPLAGFEDRPFHEAVADAEQTLGGTGYPSADVFRAAWERGAIDDDLLRQELAAHGYDDDPTASLDRLAAAESVDTPGSAVETATDRVDAVLTKWLAAFLDQGRAKWPMPDREQGFYAAVRGLAPHDGDVPSGGAFADRPAEPVAAIRAALTDYPVGEWRDVFEFQLAALPGWTGFLKQRAAAGDDWQTEYPITLAEYLAVRLTLADLFDAPVAPDETPDGPDGGTETPGADVPLPEVWLSAWEASYRDELVDAVAAASESTAETGAADGDRPDAQLVFCIDTRSEIVRRHVEATGDYETHGYAGFFGVPMRYSGYGADVTVDACPPILDAQHRIAEHPVGGDEEQAAHDRWQDSLSAGRTAVERLKANAATAFSFVESAGAGYGAALAARTLVPGRVHDLLDAADERVPDEHEFCEPSVDYNPYSVHALREGLTLDEKVEYAATAFELLGWERFARLVVFTGHASETANNPFDSSLDCGACAGNAGGPNARVLAAICNDEDVRAALGERGIEIPADTVFVAAEHNTTTDEIALFDGHVPESHAADLERLRTDLATARENAAAERAADMGAAGESGVRDTERRAADWAETRPEWGLAGNAGFVVGPRELTADLDLDGRSFLHSYDWATDPDGDALAAIVAGPLVVTQWINAQYYFATVDNAAYGSGSKVTQNPVGNVGVYQGNGGDLMAGLPLQSLYSADDEPYHQPLRLSTVVHAPVERVTDVLADNPAVAGLLDNGWLSLTVVDPTQDHRAFDYAGELEWAPVSEPAAATAEPTVAPQAADD
ncbi:DUF2309 domain-containing protein [Haloarchaeobius baliensis]|uniref:DUF2309 domain-containing protein n=1 Tax=Haloarchaeobius baliensis TaxID=1670458 RepID=UPI003F885F48